MNKDYVTRNEFNSQMAKTEKVQLIYDKDGDSIDINLDEVGGFQSQTSMVVDLTKYKRVYYTCEMFGNPTGVGILDLTKTNASGKTYGRALFSYVENSTRFFWSFNVTYDTNNKTLYLDIYENNKYWNADPSCRIIKMLGVY